MGAGKGAGAKVEVCGVRGVGTYVVHDGCAGVLHGRCLVPDLVSGAGREYALQVFGCHGGPFSDATHPLVRLAAQRGRCLFLSVC